jgi:hypothetical protein
MNGNARRLSAPVEAVIASQISVSLRSKKE